MREISQSEVADKVASKTAGARAEGLDLATLGGQLGSLANAAICSVEQSIGVRDADPDLPLPLSLARSRFVVSCCSAASEVF